VLAGRGIGLGHCPARGKESLKQLLRKRWFLLLLLGGLALAWLRPQWLRPATDRLDLRIIVPAALFIMAGSLESRSLLQSILRPWPAFWALTISYGALPALAWSAGRLLSDPGLSLGLLIIASVPCTLSSAVLWTRMAGGNDATALLTVFLTTATSWLATPVWLTLGASAKVSLDMGGMMRSLVLVLLVPVGLGQISRAVRPLARTALRHKALLDAVLRLFILAIIFKAAVDVSHRLSERSTLVAWSGIWTAAALCVGVHLIALAGGLWSSRLLRFDRAAQIAVAFAGSQKTLPISLYLFDVYFQESYPLAIIPMVVYHVGQLIVDTVIADAWAKQASGCKPAGERRGVSPPVLY
jgi:sodium/bile acid cotransporter 7